MSARRRATVVVIVLVAALLVGGLAEWLSRSPRPMADLLTGWTLVAAGVVGWWRGRGQRVSVLLIVAGFSWFVPNFSSIQVGALAWVAAHALYVHRGSLMVAVVVYPSGAPRTRVERCAAALFFGVACSVAVWSDDRAAILLAVVLVAVAVWRLGTSVPGERDARRVALFSAGALGAVIASDAVARLTFSPSDVKDVSLLAYELVLCCVAIALAAGLARSVDFDVRELLVELGDARPEGLRERLARALDDPTLEIGFWSSEEEGYVDAAGVRLSPPTHGQQATAIGDPDQPIGIVVHDRSLDDQDGFVDAVSAAARLASIHARLTADVRSQVAELAASRQRIVTAGDDECRRFERRLHDRAEAPLLVLASRLDIVDGRTTGAAGAYARLAAELRATVAELHELAAGLYPRVLDEHGLRGAVEIVAARMRTVTTVRVAIAAMPPELEAAAFFVCAEALANVDKHAMARSAEVSVIEAGAAVRIEVVDDGVGTTGTHVGAGLANLTDRVTHLGGSLHIDSPTSGGTRLIAVLPLRDGAHAHSVQGPEPHGSIARALAP